MRTSSPSLVPLFRSEMQLRLLALLLLQPERRWTLQELTDALDAPRSSVHRELERAETAGIVKRDDAARPHRFSAATEDSLVEPLVTLLHRSVGVEQELRAKLSRPDVLAAVVYGSWVTGNRRPGSDVDVLVVGDADLRELRRAVRPIGQRAGRSVDLTVMTKAEFEELVAKRSSFARRVLEGPVTQLIGQLSDVAPK